MGLQHMGDDNTISPMTMTLGTPKTVPVIKARYRDASPSVIELSFEMTRAVLERTPPVASVAMKDGILRRTWASPENRPTASQWRWRARMRRNPAGYGQRHDDAGERSHGLDREIDAAEHDDKGNPGRQNEEYRRVAGKLQERGRLKEDRLHDPTNVTRMTSVASGSHCRNPSEPSLAKILACCA